MTPALKQIQAHLPDLTLQSEFCHEADHLVEVDDIFGIWWDPAVADHSADLPTLFGWLKEIRQNRFGQP